MASNRPLFDDEDLPNWLKAAGITPGDKQNQGPASRPPAQPPAGSEDTDWISDELSDQGAPDAPSAGPFAPTSDDALPWLQDAGSGQPSQPAGSGSTLPWESAPAESSDESPLAAPPWQPPIVPDQPDASQVRTGVTGMLPWRQGVSDDSPSAPNDPFANQGKLPWEQAAPAPQSGEPDWVQDFSPSTPSGSPMDEPDFGWLDESPVESAPPAQSTGPKAAAVEDDLAWLDTAPPETPPSAVQPAAPAPAFDDLNWLNAAPPETPPAPEPAKPAAPPSLIKRLPPKPQATTPPPPPAQPPTAAQPTKVTPPPASAPIHRLPPAPPAQAQPPKMAQPPAAEPPPAQRPVQKLSSQPEPPPAPDMSNMTYDEWEQAQIAKEQEALSDPADKLLDEVPEWFSQPDAAPPSAAPSGPEFLPDWYMGMEEQSAEAAPDWFNSANLGTTSLAGPDTVQTPPSEPAVAPPADDVPDWFKGAGMEGLDFDAMFGASPTEPEAAPEPKQAPAPSAPPVPSVQPVQPARPTPPAAAQPVQPAIQPDLQPDVQPDLQPANAAPEPLDWMSELPDFGQWTADEQVDKVEGVEQAKDEPFPKSGVDTVPVSQEPMAGSADVSDLDWMLADQGGAPGEAEIPAWMFDQAESPIQPGMTGSPEAEEPTESDAPAWMRDMAPESPAASSPAQPASELDWLADFEEPPISPVSPEPKLPAQPVAAAPSGEVDLNASVDIDALLGLSGESQSATGYIPAADPVVPVDRSKQALARMEDFDLDELLGPASEDKRAGGADTIDLDELTAEALPPAVHQDTGEQEPPRAGRLRRVSPIPTPAAESPRPREELPEWLEEMRPSEMPVALHIGDQEVRIQEKPVVQMNDELRQLREHGRPFREKPEESPAPAAGPLSGITGAIQTIPEAIQPGAVSIQVPLTAAESQTRRVRLIQKMLEVEDALFREHDASVEEEEAKPVRAARTRPRVKLDRYVVTLLMAVVLIVPFFVDGLNIIPAPALDRLTPLQNSVAQAVDTIQPQQAVLVAFEYGPTAAGELDDLARTILRDIVKRGGRPVIVSTNPAGAMRGQTVMALLGTHAADLQLMNRPQPLVARQDYVVLRYLAGGAAGARSVATAILSGGFQQQMVFSTDIEGKPSGLDDISGLRNGPAFIVAETADDVRNWAEQYQAPAGEKPFTMVFLTSASASAVADTYVRSAAQTDKHLLGPLVGLRDTMTYQAVRQPAAQSASSPTSAMSQKLALQRWQSIGLSALLAGVIILVGMTLNMIRSLQRRRRR